MTSLAEKLSSMVGIAFATNDLPEELGEVKPSQRPDLAQFQCNGAMAAAKIAKKSPRDVAQLVSEYLKSNDELSQIDIAGPGFINLSVTDEYLIKHLSELASDQRLGIPLTGKGTVIVDYVGANVAKAMHVGHLRPTIIGDCLKRLIHFAGFHTLGDVHLGDWGLQMGQIISEFAIRHPDWVYFDSAFTGPYPEKAPFTYGELEQIYPQASAACKEDKDRLEQARQATVALQEGHRGYRALWEQFMILSKADMKRNLDALHVEPELWKGESDVQDLIPALEQELRAANLLVDSDGAVVIPVGEEGDKKEMPPLIFYKSDGAITYGTSDAGTIYDRVKAYPGLKKIIYVADARQNLHFEQVFRAMKKGGFVDDIELVSIGFGTMNGPDGKPFKTRSGGLPRFDELVAETRKKAVSRIEEAEIGKDLDEAEQQDIASKVMMAVLKFSDLCNQAHADYIFDIDRMTAFEGKTGPYLLYQAVRIKSLLRKAEWSSPSHACGAGEGFVITDADRPLALLLTEMPDAFEAALRNYAPHHICDYAYRLATAFSSFYGNCHILSEEDEALKKSRLALCALTYRQLAQCLEWLGIEVPERM